MTDDDTPRPRKGEGADTDTVADEKAKTVHHQNLKTGDSDPQETLIHSVAALKGEESTSLSPLYSTIDHMLEELFTSPPPAESQAQLEFSWEGYRITVYHDGNAIFQETPDHSTN